MHEALSGRALTTWDLRVPQHATSDHRGSAVLEVASVGKHMLTRLDDGWTLHTHFRMDGMWHLYRSGARWSGGPQWQVRLVLGNAEWTAVGYRMPVVDVLRTSDEPQVIGHLGPDLLADDPDLEEAVRRLHADPDRGVGDALLDQRNLAGIGTLYRAEALFLRGIHPHTPVGEVPDMDALVATARRLMHANRLHPEQSTTGRTGRGEQHWVFERPGRPCRRCGTAIRSGWTGDPPRERRAYWCPACQPDRRA